jgi:hypothetical protein
VPSTTANIVAHHQTNLCVKNALCTGLIKVPQMAPATGGEYCETGRWPF